MEDKLYMNNEGEYGKYIVQDLQTPPNMYNEEFAKMYEKFSHRILWMDGNVVPGAFQMNTAWYYAVPERDPVFEEHVHDYDELIGFFGSDPEHPYDLGADVIEIKPEDYGIWYIDCMDQPERYKDRVVEFTAMVLKTPKFPKGQFVPGRMAMTCCEADMTFLGFMCKWPEAEDYKTKQWVKVRAKVGIEYQKDYHGEGPVLYAEHVERAEEIKDVVQF